MAPAASVADKFNPPAPSDRTVAPLAVRSADGVKVEDIARNWKKSDALSFPSEMRAMFAAPAVVFRTLISFAFVPPALKLCFPKPETVSRPACDTLIAVRTEPEL